MRLTCADPGGIRRGAHRKAELLHARLLAEDDARVLYAVAVVLPFVQVLPRPVRTLRHRARVAGGDVLPEPARRVADAVRQLPGLIGTVVIIWHDIMTTALPITHQSLCSSVHETGCSTCCCTCAISRSTATGFWPIASEKVPTPSRLGAVAYAWHPARQGGVLGRPLVEGPRITVHTCSYA